MTIEDWRSAFLGFVKREFGEDGMPEWGDHVVFIEEDDGKNFEKTVGICVRLERIVTETDETRLEMLLRRFAVSQGVYHIGFEREVTRDKGADYDVEISTRMPLNPPDTEQEHTLTVYTDSDTYWIIGDPFRHVFLGAKYCGGYSSTEHIDVSDPDACMKFDCLIEAKREIARNWGIAEWIASQKDPRAIRPLKVTTSLKVTTK